MKKKIFSTMIALVMFISFFSGIEASAAPIGENTVTLQGKTISAPNYTVTIPEVISFGDVTKKKDTTADAQAIKNTSDYKVEASHQYLFDNDKALSVTLNTDNKIRYAGSGNKVYNLDFDLYKKGATDSLIINNSRIIEVNPTLESEDSELTTSEVYFYGAIDQRKIKAAGNYTGTVTFIVALEDK
ncbi:MAG: hypothetical protein RR128_08410 [Clostridium sp.]